MTGDIKILIKKPFEIIIVNFLLNLLIGFCILVPLSYVIPKKKNLLVFSGRHKDLYGDNVKYLYQYFNSIKDISIEHYYLAENKKLYSDLKKHRYPVIYHPSVKSFWMLLRSKIIIIDSNTWIARLKAQAAYYTYKVQLWHGSGIKNVILDNPDVADRKSWIARLYFKIKGTHVIYDLMLFTSEKQAARRSKMFMYRNKIIEGQPRNDILFAENVKIDQTYGADINCINAAGQFKNKGYKIILYTPTWRDWKSGSDDLNMPPIDLDRLSGFLQNEKCIFVFKFHPFVTDSQKFSNYPNILLYNAQSDIYPFLHMADFMVTDYSSIYLDYVLLNRPIIFFAYDFDIYTGEKKQTNAGDYLKLTPGPICHDYDEFENEMYKHIAENQDDYIDERKRVKDFIYDIQDGRSCERIYSFLKKVL
ncbi:MAG: CDP-glycerol glycerophosphotransferase family protein [Spirochaetes bacterium]|nr:CDP-glycerol glycerophosphotransferase family protein [Spirochaetota bacterium]